VAEKGREVTITPEQIKAARKLLGWSHANLAGRVHMSDARIWAFETGRQQLSAFELDLVREALESAGVEFTISEGPGVRLRKAAK
jgi:transcriptional regulator with XRE-family HTH domain